MIGYTTVSVNIWYYFSLVFQGDYVWLEPETKGEFDNAIGAQVVASEGGQLRLKDDDGKVIIA